MLIVWLKRAESPKALSPGRIYAILHFSNYRKKFKEQLKYQFPRIPYPQNEEELKKIASLGNPLVPPASYGQYGGMESQE